MTRFPVLVGGLDLAGVSQQEDDFELPFNVFRLDHLGMSHSTFLRFSSLGLFALWEGGLAGPNSDRKYPQICVRYADQASP